MNIHNIGTAQARRELQKKWLILPVEVKYRELKSRLLLAMSILDSNVAAIIGRQADLVRLLDKLPYGIYFEKSLDGDKIDFFNKKIFSRPSMLLVGNDEEGLSVTGNKRFYLSQRHSVNVLRDLRMFFAWGDVEAKEVRSAYPAFADKVIVTGNPRTDIWSTSLRDIHQLEARALKRRWGDFILMPSSFSAVQHGLGNTFVEDELARRGELETDELKQEHASRDLFFRLSLQRFRDLALKLASTFKDAKVVIRPHPSEGHDAWNDLAKRSDRIFVDGTGDIGPWIMASKVLVHSFCTTGLEASLMGRPVVTYRSTSGFSYEHFIGNRVGEIATTAEEAVDQVSRVLSGTFEAAMEGERREFPTWLKPYLAGLGEKVRCSSRIADALRGLDDWMPCNFTPHYIDDDADYVTKAKRYLSNAIGRSHRLPQYYENKFPSTPIKEIRKTLKSLSDLSGVREPNITQLGRNVFAIWRN